MVHASQIFTRFSKLPTVQLILEVGLNINSYYNYFPKNNMLFIKIKIIMYHAYNADTTNGAG